MDEEKTGNDSTTIIQWLRVIYITSWMWTLGFMQVQNAVMGSIQSQWLNYSVQITFVLLPILTIWAFFLSLRLGVLFVSGIGVLFLIMFFTPAY